MNIYLSWSPLFTLLVVLATLVVTFILVRQLKKINEKKAAKIVRNVGLCSLLLIAFLAIDVGTKQEQLNRERFDAIVPEISEKVERQGPTMHNVQETFDTLVTEKQEAIQQEIQQ